MLTMKQNDDDSKYKIKSLWKLLRPLRTVPDGALPINRTLPRFHSMAFFGSPPLQSIFASLPLFWKMSVQLPEVKQKAAMKADTQLVIVCVPSLCWKIRYRLHHHTCIDEYFHLPKVIQRMFLDLNISVQILKKNKM